MYIDPVGQRIDANELFHHGIKGQKWGVRRYQNADGSLTPEGMKRYGNPRLARKIYKELSKEIYEKRRELRPQSNEYARNGSIGPNSSKALDRMYRNLDDVEKSEDFKRMSKALHDLDKKDIYGSEYTKSFDKIRNDFLSTEAGKKWRANQWITINGNLDPLYINGAGKDVSIGYLKDLGFSDEAAKHITKMLAKQNIVL